jgi:hypothetical protein
MRRSRQCGRRKNWGWNKESNKQVLPSIICEQREHADMNDF